MKLWAKTDRSLGLIFLLLWMSIVLRAGRESQNVRLRDNNMEHWPGKIEIYDALKIAVESLKEKKMMYRKDYKLTATRVDNEGCFGLSFFQTCQDDGQTRFLPGF